MAVPAAREAATAQAAAGREAAPAVQRPAAAKAKAAGSLDPRLVPWAVTAVLGRVQGGLARSWVPVRGPQPLPPRPMRQRPQLQLQPLPLHWPPPLWRRVSPQLHSRSGAELLPVPP